jgi:hypothetical protein
MMKGYKKDSMDAREINLTVYEQQISVGTSSAVLTNLPPNGAVRKNKPKPFVEAGNM